MIDSQQILDALVVGGGIAGLTAATLLADHGHSVAVADELCAGGQLLNLGHLRDYPGLDVTVTGPELAARCIDAALDKGVEMLPVRVERLERSDVWRAHTTDGQVQARTIVLATGRAPDVSAVPGAAQLVGRGVSLCASCDGPLFAGRPVAVAGAGWWLATEVEQLAHMAETVTVVLAGDGPAGSGQSWNQTIALPNVNVITNARLVGLESGERGLDSLVVEGQGGRILIPAHALFWCDDDPADVPQGLSIDMSGELGAIETIDGTRTAMPGLFAAGTVRVGSSPYLVAAAADGVRAALAAGAFLHSIKALTVEPS